MRLTFCKIHNFSTDIGYGYNDFEFSYNWKFNIEGGSTHKGGIRLTSWQIYLVVL